MESCKQIGHRRRMTASAQSVSSLYCAAESEINRIVTMRLAGGGIKPGITLGESDELGFNVVKDKVHVHDLHATLLHLLGFDHTKLTYRFQGRDFRLTDVHGNVVKEILA